MGARFGGLNTQDRLSRTVSVPQADNGAGITVAVWVNIATQVNEAGVVQILSNPGNSTADYIGWGCRTTQGFRTWIRAGGITKLGADINADITGEWYFLAFVLTADESTVHWYWRHADDASLSTSSTTITPDSFASFDRLYLGASSFNANLTPDGDIAHARIWLNELSEAQLLTESLTPTPVVTTGLHIASSFADTQSGTQFLDESGNDNHWTEANSVEQGDGPPFHAINAIGAMTAVSAVQAPNTGTGTSVNPTLLLLSGTMPLPEVGSGGGDALPQLDVQAVPATTNPTAGARRRTSALDERFRGLTVPIVKKPSGFFGVEYTRDIVRSSLAMILSTRIGERVMLPEFGSRLPELVFEPNDHVLHALARRYVSDAIARWEPRVSFTSVLLRSDEHIIALNVQYRIRDVGLDDAIVLTFRREGL